MVLTVEGDPTDSLITLGGCASAVDVLRGGVHMCVCVWGGGSYGNAKRVGHDISPMWMSMVSLVDIGSGLYPFAHNGSNATYGGW